MLCPARETVRGMVDAHKSPRMLGAQPLVVFGPGWLGGRVQPAVCRRSIHHILCSYASAALPRPHATTPRCLPNPPSPLACRVSTTRLDGPEFRLGSDDGSDGGGLRPVPRGACANISGLEDGVKYRFRVVPHSTAHGDGPAANTTAVVCDQVGAALGRRRRRRMMGGEQAPWWR